ncbi:MAG: pentapeptide repeat-containing protein [Alphaproteobacteria bacterium]
MEQERHLRGRDGPERDGVLKSIAGLNLSGRDLRLANFEPAVLPHTDFRYATLSGSHLASVDLTRAHVTRRVLRIKDGMGINANGAKSWISKPATSGRTHSPKQLSFRVDTQSDRPKIAGSGQRRKGRDWL